MTVQANVDFQGIVMFERNHRDNDLLVKIFTREFGKKMFFLKNAKKANYQLASSILPFSHGTYTGLVRDDGLSYINAVKKVQQFEQIFQVIELNAFATLILNLIDAAFEDNQPIQVWFDQVLTGLDLINGGVDPEVIADIVQMQLLPSFGVSPVWNQCVECGRSDLPMDFSDKFDGMLCSNHFALDDHRWHLSTKAAQTVRLLSGVNLKQIGTISVSNDTKQQIWKLLDLIYSNQVGIRLKSRSFIDQMKKWDKNSI